MDLRGFYGFYFLRILILGEMRWGDIAKLTSFRDQVIAVEEKRRQVRTGHFAEGIARAGRKTSLQR
jgi:hypothetical protein